jgi:hypothetical protein
MPQQQHQDPTTGKIEAEAVREAAPNDNFKITKLPLKNNTNYFSLKMN